MFAIVSSATPMTADMGCEPARQQSGGFSHVISHEQGKQPGYSQNRYAHQHRKSHLGQSVFFQSAKELRAYLVAYGKQKQQEKH